MLILEGIFALHDPRVLDMLDLKIYTEAESDLCLSRRREYCEKNSFPMSRLTVVVSQLFAMSVSEAEISKAALSSGLVL